MVVRISEVLRISLASHNISAHACFLFWPHSKMFPEAVSFLSGKFQGRIKIPYCQDSVLPCLLSLFIKKKNGSHGALTMLQAHRGGLFVGTLFNLLISPMR